MNHERQFIVEVTGLSPLATEKDIYDFFSFCGAIENVEIVRGGENACTAYVTFNDSYSVETAVLLSGATLLDQRVCITRWGYQEEEFSFWNSRPRSFDDETDLPPPPRSEFISNAGEAVTMAQEVVKSMLEKGFVLGKDALTKAKTYDESHGVSAAATAKVAELNQKIGLTDRIYAGVEAVKHANETYGVFDMTKSAFVATGRTASTAANTVVNSSYFANGAVWLSGALDRAAKTAADYGARANK